jgi:hypothetical protein
MNNRYAARAIILFAIIWMTIMTVAAGEAEFNAVVRLIESFYHVKHKSLPILAKVGVKAARTAGRIAGGPAEQLAEAGSIKLAIFEDQDFKASAGVNDFRKSVRDALDRQWTPLIQVLSSKAEDQNYIYLKDEGEKIRVLVVNIGRRDATVVQMDVAPQKLALLLQDPETAGKALTDEATSDGTQ